MTELLEVAKLFGVPMALVLFFIWRDSRREKELSDRIRSLEDWGRITLSDTLMNVSSIVKENTEAFSKFASLLEKRSCLRDK